MFCWFLFVFCFAQAQIKSCNLTTTVSHTQMSSPAADPSWKLDGQCLPHEENMLLLSWGCLLWFCHPPLTPLAFTAPGVPGLFLRWHGLSTCLLCGLPACHWQITTTKGSPLVGILCFPLQILLCHLVHVSLCCWVCLVANDTDTCLPTLVLCTILGCTSTWWKIPHVTPCWLMLAHVGGEVVLVELPPCFRLLRDIRLCM